MEPISLFQTENIKLNALNFTLSSTSFINLSSLVFEQKNLIKEDHKIWFDFKKLIFSELYNADNESVAKIKHYIGVCVCI